MQQIVPHNKELQKQEQVFQFVFKGFWTYVLDHARVDYNGRITINFCIDGKDDFYHKLKSRVFTKYSKRNASELYELAEKTREYYKANLKIHRFYKKSFWRLHYLNVLRKLNRYCRERIVLEDFPYIRDK